MPFKVPRPVAKRSRQEPSPSGSSSSDSSASGNGIPSKRLRAQQREEESEGVRRLQELKAEFQRAMLSLERNINRNIEDRMKYAEQPERFMDSEVDLDSDIRRLQALLPVNPELYPECVRLNGVETILGLLAHENVDIVTGVIDLLSEIVEPDVTFVENMDFMNQIIEELIEKQVVEMCVAVMDRFDERIEDEARAVHDTLHILECLVELRPDRVCRIVAERTKLIDRILTYVNDHGRLLKLEERATDGTDDKTAQRQLQDLLSGVTNRPNKLYMCEMLAIFLQTSEEIRMQMAHEDRLDRLLQAIAFFRRVAPKTPEQIEAAENLFNCLCTCLMSSDIQNMVRELAGIELMILFVRERPFARMSAVKCLYYCLLDNFANCVRFIDVGGIGTLFALLMASGIDDGQKNEKRKRKRKKRKRVNLDEIYQHEEHVVSILNTLMKFFCLPSNSEPNDKSWQSEFESVGINAQYVREIRSRIVAKFMEHNMEKTNKLMAAFFSNYDRVSQFDEQVLSGELEERLGEELDSETIYVERLSAGLFALQQLSCVIADLMVNHPDINRFVRGKLKERNVAVAEVAVFLKEYASNTADPREKDRLERDILPKLEEPELLQ